MSKLSLKDILSGDILAKQWFKQQYKLILLIGGLIFIYIYTTDIWVKDNNIT